MGLESGGFYGHLPKLWKCRVGVGTPFEDKNVYKGGVFGTLPGSVQTVPRAELYGILTVYSKEGVIVTDSEICWKLFGP